MAESPSPQTPTVPDISDQVQYWCYQCEKRVSVETQSDLTSDIVCYECKNGFVESIAPTADDIENPTEFSNHVIQVLRLMARVAHGGDDDAPPPPPSDLPDPSNDDYLRIELDGWDNDEDDDSVQVRTEEEQGDDDGDEDGDGDGSDDDDEDEEETTDEEILRLRRNILRRRLREFAARAASRRNRILNWADILTGLEDQSIELRLQMAEIDGDGYVGNPRDYVDAAGYEALLQNLAEESDGNGRRGAPPAAKSAISALESFNFHEEDDALVCVVCKDSVNVGEMTTKLPCGHSYHRDCIVPWLSSRNSCPICRFELPTDDPEYEEEKKKRSKTTPMAGGSSSSRA